MKFADEYFEDEVRCGFYVDSLMKCCWASQLEVLEKIDKVCRKYNIQYFAEWGTLLGAIRHGGFIPWDDDMDIAMKRVDYERFLKVAQEELPEGYKILNYQNEEHYWDVMTRVVNADFVDATPEFLDKNFNNPYASGIDIFPLDYVSNNKGEEELQKEIVELIKAVADTNGMGNLTADELEHWLTVIENVCRQKIDREGNIKNQLYKLLCYMYALYSEEETDRIALIAQYLDSGCSVYPKECYADSIRMPFDEITIPIPMGYDTVLKLKYGDYMKNVRTGGGHDYPYYEKQQDYLKGYGASFPQYEYPKDMEKRVKKLSFRRSLEEKLELLGKIQEKLELLVKYGQQETVLNLLQELQNVAIAIGNSIEKKAGQGTKAVTALEQYCEVVFELYETMCQSVVTDGTAVRAILDETLQMVVQTIENTHFKKEIVFMPYKAKHWKAFESVWRKAYEDEDCDVKVIPLPYYYKRQLGAKLSEMQYDGDKFPEYVPITPFHKYSMENNHPDCIYIQSPYDQWNHTVTVHDDYYAPKLWQHTEELIYIPWFKIDEMRPEDGRALKSRKHFVSMPGVVHADKVIVQSEAMKQSYVDYLSEWAGEDTRPIWEQKILGLGSPLDDVEEEMPQRPDGWEDKKVMLYHISGNGLMEHKEKMLQKIENSLQIFEQQSEKIQVLWLQDTLLRERLVNRTPGIYRRYERLLAKCQEKAWITVMEAGNEDTAVKLADAYYGDAGRSAQMMKQAAKPVMLQNVDI